MSRKPRPRSQSAASRSKSGAAKRPATAAKRGAGGAKAPTPAPAPRSRIPMGWAFAGGVVVVVGAIALAVALSSGGGSSASAGGSAAPASAELVANTTAANVPLLDAEGVATHIHTTLVVEVNGKNKEVPAFIGIDTASGKIAALHTHDASGLIHLESAKENDDYTLDQFLTVWGMPKDAAGRCAFFGAASPCTLSVTSKDSGPVGLDVNLKDYDSLTLTVAST